MPIRTDRRVILDTHAWIWLMLGSPQISVAARETASAAARSGDLLVPAIVPWEVAMLAERGRITLTAPTKQVLQLWLSHPGTSLAPLSPDIAVDAVSLPGWPHKDPVDRMIVATARVLGGTVITRDDTILRYSADGHVQAFSA